MKYLVQKRKNGFFSEILANILLQNIFSLFKLNFMHLFIIKMKIFIILIKWKVEMTVENTSRRARHENVCQAIQNRWRVFKSSNVLFNLDNLIKYFTCLCIVGGVHAQWSYFVRAQNRLSKMSNESAIVPHGVSSICCVIIHQQWNKFSITSRI